MSIISLIHPGSGCGDQLFSYIATRSLAEQKGYAFSVVGKENFKGSSFIDLDWGEPTNLKYTEEFPARKLIITEPHTLYEPKVNYYDPEFNFIEDGTVIDGCTLQDERYWDIGNVQKWLNVKWLEIPPDVCVINFRGGEFTMFPDLFLTQDYWDEAIGQMLRVNPNMKFEIHTDDPESARGMFWSREFHPDVIHDISINWRSLRHAKYAILSNSAFGIIPRLLKQHEDQNAITISPRYHARRNTKEWSMPSNFYESFLYL